MPTPTAPKPDTPATADGSSDRPLPVVAPATQAAFAHHPRRWGRFHYVYPVVSRRSGGLSIGINLNIDKACNFDCVYCCVDRTTEPVRRDVDLDQIRCELAEMLDIAISGEIWTAPPFDAVSPELRRINDIAFSGDGEPTVYPRFDEACRIAVDLKNARGLDSVKIVVITNATALDRQTVRTGLDLLDAHNGEVWAKLDAGTEEYYRLVERTKFPLEKVLANILECGRTRPIVIQSLFMSVRGEPLPDAEYEAFLDRLCALHDGVCNIKLVQLYTTARRTAEAWVGPLTNAHLDRLGERLRERLPGLNAEVYYGVTGSD